jgi:Sporulation inhibitor of replication protein SirA
MRTYQVYLIEDEFVQHFFGREKLFFNLFLEYIQSTGSLRSILQKQIEYVTKIIPKQQVEIMIKQQMQKKKNFRVCNEEYYIDNNGASQATLSIHDDVLVVRAEGNYVAETAFFECIRKCGTSFLAIDFDHERFGWLKPIKERKFV